MSPAHQHGRPWVKICGNTRLDDCLHAAACGADAVGFVFAPGKRTVTPEQVGAISARLPASIERIGVFTSGDAREIASAAGKAGLTGVQLHGPLSRQILEDLLTFPLPCKVIQTLHWRVDVPSETQQQKLEAELDALNAWDLAEAILMDSQTPFAGGGTGTSFDWESAAPLLRRSQANVIVAGGLRPETVALAIAALEPWGVDVSSGVERAPGIKDPEKVRTFIETARAAMGTRQEAHVPSAVLS